MKGGGGDRPVQSSVRVQRTARASPDEDGAHCDCEGCEIKLCRSQPEDTDRIRVCKISLGAGSF